MKCARRRLLGTAARRRSERSRSGVKRRRATNLRSKDGKQRRRGPLNREHTARKSISPDHCPLGDAYKRLWLADSPTKHRQSSANSLRICAILPGVSWCWRAASPVVSPIASVLAIPRFRGGKRRSQSAKSIRLAAKSAGVQRPSSTRASFQPASRSKRSRRSILRLWRRRAWGDMMSLPLARVPVRRPERY